MGISGMSPHPIVRAVGVAVLATVAAGLLGVVSPVSASTSHAGWPRLQHLVMDKGPGGEQHVLRGRPNVHNWLLGGYGDDTIYGGNAGDVIWGDYHPSGWPAHQTAVIHGGNGKNFIYSNDTVNQVWTGTNPATVVHAHEGSGTIHCQNPHIIVFTSHHALPRYHLDGCRRISFYSVGY
jgi:hemolysin type calcium-binding protein